MNGRPRMRVAAKVAAVLVALLLAAVPLTMSTMGSAPHESGVVGTSGPYPGDVFCGTCVYVPPPSTDG
ncbi:hypothetical protein Voc01_033610 [Virgisporangium ochraceum]|uniref:Secreted protein n=2 Tax=Virgisporangium ochraceum TaxID=65505 RepID=A0A8J3ZR86_9ACTN|nr:hypothetical protein Voc01_033610 [Virgisporangium ochraceum]